MKRKYVTAGYRIEWLVSMYRRNRRINEYLRTEQNDSTYTLFLKPEAKQCTWYYYESYKTTMYDAITAVISIELSHCKKTTVSLTHSKSKI